MNKYEDLLNDFVSGSLDILRDNLTGIYLHGSAAMGCFNEEKSDIDLLIVVKKDISDEIKLRYMDMVITLNGKAPKKGLELSVVKEAVCNPFVYPTPFELHFSNFYLNWYLTKPDDYIQKMKGTDKDLAAHCTIIYYRGKTLYGGQIRDVFAKVDKEYYLDSILYDIENVKEEIARNTLYYILNLCRILAYKEENLILSKLEGGEWGLKNIPKQYSGLIFDAVKEYKTGVSADYDSDLTNKFAEFMTGRIER